MAFRTDIPSRRQIDGIFRSVNSYPQLADCSLPGSPEALTDAELGEAARKVLDGLYADQLRDLTEVLFADIDAKLAGTIDDESGVVSLNESEQAGDYGVIDELCRRAILAGGTVLAVRAADVPGGGPAAALLRYPV